MIAFLVLTPLITVYALIILNQTIVNPSPDLNYTMRLLQEFGEYAGYPSHLFDLHKALQFIVEHPPEIKDLSKFFKYYTRLDPLYQETLLNYVATIEFHKLLTPGGDHGPLLEPFRIMYEHFIDKYLPPGEPPQPPQPPHPPHPMIPSTPVLVVTGTFVLVTVVAIARSLVSW